MNDYERAMRGLQRAIFWAYVALGMVLLSFAINIYKDFIAQ